MIEAASVTSENDKATQYAETTGLHSLGNGTRSSPTTISGSESLVARATLKRRDAWSTHKNTAPITRAVERLEWRPAPHAIWAWRIPYARENRATNA